MRVERIGLEDHRDVAVAGRQVVDNPVADSHLALGDRLQAGDHAERGRLATTGRPDEDHELAVGNVYGEVANGARAVAVHLSDMRQRHFRHTSDLSPWSRLPVVRPHATSRYDQEQVAIDDRRGLSP
jgi:hypothetical protein